MRTAVLSALRAQMEWMEADAVRRYEQLRSLEMSREAELAYREKQNALEASRRNRAPQQQRLLGRGGL